MNSLQELCKLNFIDYTIITIVLLSTLISLFRGLVRELFSLTIWFLGFWIALKFCYQFADFFASSIASVALRHIISFTAIFIMVLILGSIFNKLFSLLVDKTGFSSTDRILGMIFGAVRGIFLVSILLLAVSLTSFVEDNWWQSSLLVPHFEIILKWLGKFIPAKVAALTMEAGS